MKCSIHISLAALMGGLLLASVAHAGVNYVSEHEQFQASKQAQAEESEGRHFHHTSKYSREQEKGQTLTQPAQQAPRPANKYDRQN